MDTKKSYIIAIKDARRNVAKCERNYRNLVKAQNSYRNPPNSTLIDSAFGELRLAKSNLNSLRREAKKTFK